MIWLQALMAIVTSLGTADARGPLASPRQTDDMQAAAQTMIAALYPELAEPGRYVIWFQTAWRSMSFTEPVPFTAFVAPADHTVHDPHREGPAYVLEAYVAAERDGAIAYFRTDGSRFTHGEEMDALARALQQAGRPTPTDVDRLMDAAGARFSPAKQSALLAFVRPTITEIERHAGTLTIDEVIAPGVYVDEAGIAPPIVRTNWGIRGHSERRGKRYRVTLSFEPFDGRLMNFQRVPD